MHEVYEVFPEIVPTLSPHVASGLAEKLAYDLMESETIRKPEHWLSLTFFSSGNSIYRSGYHTGID